MVAMHHRMKDGPARTLRRRRRSMISSGRREGKEPAMSTANRFSRFSLAAARTALALGAAIMLGTLGDATPARAQGAWCAEYSGMDGGTNCGFYTLQQCRAAISGVGGTCSPNPWVTNNPPPRRKARRRDG
jgi:Protein of unknown function (DUF3551)